MNDAPADASTSARADVLWGILLAGGTGLLLWIASQPREMTIFSQADNMFWPRHVLWPLFFFSLLLVATRVGRFFRVRVGAESNLRVFARPLILSIICIAYFVLIELIGFLPATLLFSGSAIYFLGAGSLGLKTSVLFAAVTTLVMYGVFLKIVAAPLPRGVGIFREMSFLLY